MVEANKNPKALFPIHTFEGDKYKDIFKEPVSRIERWRYNRNMSHTTCRNYLTQRKFTMYKIHTSGHADTKTIKKNG